MMAAARHSTAGSTGIKQGLSQVLSPRIMTDLIHCVRFNHCQIVADDGIGTVRYVGELLLERLKGKTRIGVEFSEPIGKNNGSLEGHAYFSCPDNHGVFTAPAKITVVEGAAPAKQETPSVSESDALQDGNAKSAPAKMKAQPDAGSKPEETFEGFAETAQPDPVHDTAPETAPDSKDMTDEGTGTVASEETAPKEEHLSAAELKRQKKKSIREEKEKRKAEKIRAKSIKSEKAKAAKVAKKAEKTAMKAEKSTLVADFDGDAPEGADEPSDPAAVDATDAVNGTAGEDSKDMADEGTGTVASEETAPKEEHLSAATEAIPPKKSNKIVFVPPTEPVEQKSATELVRERREARLKLEAEAEAAKQVAELEQKRTSMIYRIQEKVAKDAVQNDSKIGLNIGELSKRPAKKWTSKNKELAESQPVIEGERLDELSDGTEQASPPLTSNVTTSSQRGRDEEEAALLAKMATSLDEESFRAWKKERAVQREAEEAATAKRAAEAARAEKLTRARDAVAQKGDKLLAARMANQQG